MKSFKHVNILIVMLFVTLFAGAGFIVGCVTLEEPDKELPAIIESENANYKHSPVVRLHNRNTGAFFCSGTVISTNYVVTAGHCLKRFSKTAEQIDVRVHDGTKLAAWGTAVFRDERSDLGLVMGDFAAFNAMKYDIHPQYIIETMLAGNEHPVIMCGFPYGGKGYCIALNDRSTYYFQFAGSGVLYPGMSGGPVIDYLTGTLIGVNSAMSGPAAIISPIVELLVHATVKPQQ